MDDDLARPALGEQRLDRGTEWFLMRDGRIAEVRAYHHGGKKNPQGDLLGFDHAGRGYTMLWTDRESGALAMAVIKDNGRARAAAALHRRARGAAGVRSRASSSKRDRARTWTSGRRRAEFPRELFERCGELGLPRPQVPRGVRRPGRRLRPRRRLDRGAVALAAPAAASPPGSAPTPGSRRRRSASSAPRSRSQRLLVPGDQGREDRRARDHRARRRLRRRRRSAPSPARWTAATSSTAPRPSSPTASARTSSSAP